MTIYLDHAASTPPRPEARAALDACLDAANASSTHHAGQQARVAVEASRESVASALHCSPHDVVFTSGGTEADNLAVKGIVWASTTAGVPHVVTTAVEHAAVAEPVRWLAERGEITCTVVAPRPDGCVDPEAVLAAVRTDTVLVSVMAANNELGSVNDIATLGAELGPRGVPLHTDAVQAVATLDVDAEAWGVAALATSGHKFGAPQGVGAAVLRRGLPVAPLSHGGGQDRGVRSGTFAAALDAAFGAALEAAVGDRAALAGRLRGFTDRMEAALTAIDGVHRNGPTTATERLASHLHLGLEAVDDFALALELDRAGIAASAGSACGSGALAPSRVLAATGAPGTPLRLTLGWTTTADEVDEAIDRLGDVLAGLVERGRRASVGPVS